MDYTYQATIKPDVDGGFIVTFADVPEAITAGDTRAEAIENAREALGLALRGIMQEGRDLPEPTATDGTAVAVAADVAAKLAVILAFRHSGMSKSELARQLGKDEAEARRILDPDHATKINLLQDASRVLGQEIVIRVRNAA